MSGDSIGKLRIGIALDGAELQKSLQATQRNLKSSMAQFQASTAGVDKYNKSIDDLQREEQSLQKVLRDQKTIMSTLEQQWKNAIQSKGEDSAETKKLEASYYKSVAAMKKTELQLGAVEKQIQEQEKANNKLRRTFDTLSEGFRNANKSMMTLGNSMTRVSANVAKATARVGVAVGTTLAVGLGYAVKKAADFEQGLSNVGAVSNATEEQMKKLHDQAIKLGASTKYSATEVTQAQEELVKAGLSVNQVLRDGEAALNLATAGDLDLAKAAEIAGVAINSFKSEGLDLTHVANKMAGAANASATSVEEMQFGMSMSAAVASGLGVSFDDLNTSLAVFANNGLKGSDAGTSLKTLLMNLSPISDDAYNQMQDLGIITYDAARAMQTMSEMGLKPASSSFDDVRKSVEKYLIETEGLKAGSSGLKKETDKLMMSQGFMSNKFFDANGNVRTQAEIAQVLQDSMKGLTKEQQTVAQKIMFGTDAVRASNIMVREGAKGYAEMNKEIGKTTAQEVATKKLDNLKGSIENLKGGLETLAISVGEKLIPIIKKWVDTINKNMPEIQKKVGAFVDRIMNIDWAGIWKNIKTFASQVFPPLINGFKNVANFLKNMDDNTKQNVATLGILAVVLGPVIAVVGTLGTVVTAVFGAFKFLGGTLGVVFKVLQAIAPFIGTVLLGILNACWVFLKGSFIVVWKTLTGVLKIVTGTFKAVISIGRVLITVIAGISAPVWIAIAAITALIAIGVLIWKNWDWLKKKASEIGTAIKNAFVGMKNKITEIFGNIGGWFSEKWTSVINGIVTFGSNVGKKIKEIVGFIKKPFQDLDLFEIGKNIIEGLGNGIKKKMQWIKDKISEIGEKIPEWLQKLLGRFCSLA